MPRPRRSYAQRQLRRELIRFLRLNRRLVLQSAGGWLTVALLINVLPVPPYATGVAHGILGATFGWVMLLAFLLCGDVVHLIAGSYAEQFTRDALAAAAKRRDVHNSVDNIELAGSDIDHLVLTPAGALALETKWRFRSRNDHWLAAATRQARRSAAKAESVLRSVHVAHPLPVRPVVVVWGGAARDLPGQPARYDGVTVVPGQHLAAWLQRHGNGPLDPTVATELHTRLERFAAAHTPAAGPTGASSTDDAAS